MTIRRYGLLTSMCVDIVRESVTDALRRRVFWPLACDLDAVEPFEREASLRVALTFVNHRDLADAIRIGLAGAKMLWEERSRSMYSFPFRLDAIAGPSFVICDHSFVSVTWSVGDNCALVNVQFGVDELMKGNRAGACGSDSTA